MSYYNSTIIPRRGFWIQNGDFQIFLVADDISAMTTNGPSSTKIYLHGGGELVVPVHIDKLIEGWKGEK